MFLPGFMERYNARFAKVPRRPGRPASTAQCRAWSVCATSCACGTSAMSASNWRSPTIGGGSFSRRNEITRGLPGQYVDSYEFCGRASGVPLEGRIPPPTPPSDKDQRVTHCRNHREQAPWRRPCAHPGGTGQGAAKEEARGHTAHTVRADRPSERWLELQACPSRQGERSQPGLRYLRSPPCQAALALALWVTFLPCTASDISTRLQQPREEFPGPGTVAHASGNSTLNVPPAPLLAGDPQPSAMAVDDVLHDREAQPGTAHGAAAYGYRYGRTRSVRRGTCCGSIPRHHDPSRPHGSPCPSCCPLPSSRRQRQVDGAIRTAVFQRVLGEVQEHLHQLVTVAEDQVAPAPPPCPCSLTASTASRVQHDGVAGQLRRGPHRRKACRPEPRAGPPGPKGASVRQPSTRLSDRRSETSRFIRRAFVLHDRQESVARCLIVARGSAQGLDESPAPPSAACAARG